MGQAGRERKGLQMVSWIFTRAALVFGLALTLCATAPAAETKFGDIRFVTAGPAMTMLPMQVVIEKGFDKEAGFTAVLTRSTGAIGIKALVAGDFDFSMSAGSALAAAVSGAPVKVVYVHVAKPLFFLYSRTGIDGMKGLEGARVGIDAVGGSQDVAVRLAMQAAGADPSKVIFMAMGFQNIPGALIATAIDAGVISPPLEFQLAKSDKKFTDMGFLGDLVPSLSGGLATNEKMIRERPDALRAVLRAHGKAHRFILENRDQVIPIIAKFMNLTPDEAAHSYDNLVVHLTKTGVVPVAKQREIVAEQATALKIANPPPLDAIFDFSFIGP
jgi:NitT/TauT family transport system substrate-binding protein